MSKTFFTSDTHFGHANIIRYSKRPFRDVREMDDTMIDRINEKVGHDDILWHLGDFAFYDINGWTKIRNRINCNFIHLILGNHDHKRVNREKAVYDLFESVQSYKEIRIDGHDITLNHYAQRVWNKSHHGAWHLYGHSHGSLPDDPHSLSFDIGVDCHNFYPLNMTEISAIMDKKRWKPIDHHGGDI